MNDESQDRASARRVGRYEIRRELGRGMMGVVYEAMDTALDRTVALKTIQLAFASTPRERESFEQRFIAEAKAAARLSHPNIVVIHDVGRDPDTGILFMALEYLEGRTLEEEWVEGVPYDWRKALTLVARLAEALHVAHEKAVVHRDIKPANIMLLSSGEPKIMDFGIAKIAASKLTVAGQMFGTPLYMSPEQALGGVVDGRSDLYSLGAVLYQLLTGRQTVSGETVARILALVAHQNPSPPSHVVPSLPEDVDYLMARALAKPPDQRYPNGRAMAADIEDILAGRPPRCRSEAATLATAGGTLVTPGGPGASPGGLEVTAPTISADGSDIPPETAGGSTAPAGPHRDAPSAEASLPPLPPPAATGTGGPRRGVGAALLALGLGLGAGLVYLVGSGGKAGPAGSESALAGQARAAPEPGVPAATPSPSSGLSVEGLRALLPGSAATLALDFEHHLQDGTLKLWIDRELVLEERLTGRVTKEFGGVTLSKGLLDSQVRVKPGWHDIWVEVRWDEHIRSKGISGDFPSAGTRRLKIRVGRIRRNLSLDWM